MTHQTVQANDKTIEEIRTDAYALTYADNEDDFLCVECNTEQEGTHMEHSIFFQEYTDVATLCLTCVHQHHADYA